MVQFPTPPTPQKMPKITFAVNFQVILSNNQNFQEKMKFDANIVCHKYSKVNKF